MGGKQRVREWGGKKEGMGRGPGLGGAEPRPSLRTENSVRGESRLAL